MSLITTVITGATSGIGKETAFALAKKNHTLYLLVRNMEKGARLKKQIIDQTGNKNIFIIKCDLSDMASVKGAAEELNQKLFAVHVLVNNAGGIYAEREETTDGFEKTFAVNHLGHFLLTNSLMPLLANGQARVINVSSNAYKIGNPRFDDLQSTGPYSSFKAYGTAKLFNIYFTKSLAERFIAKGITAFALHPGVVRTAFGAKLSGVGKLLLWLSKPLMISAKKGAKTTIFLATKSNLSSKSGRFFVNSKPVKVSELANDVAARIQLWEASEKLIQPFMINNQNVTLNVN